MKISIERINDDFLFEAKGATGYPIRVDNSDDGKPQGASPMELMLSSVACCSAIDVVFILNKQRQQIDSFKIEAEARRKEVKQSRPFEAMHLTLYLDGAIDPKKARRAAELSFEKYCSASITLQNSVDISFKVVVNGTEV